MVQDEKKLVIVLDSLVMDVIISRGRFPLFTVFSTFDVCTFVPITRGRSDDFPY